MTLINQRSYGRFTAQLQKFNNKFRVIILEGKSVRMLISKTRYCDANNLFNRIIN